MTEDPESSSNALSVTCGKKNGLIPKFFKLLGFERGEDEFVMWEHEQVVKAQVLLWLLLICCFC